MPNPDNRKTNSAQSVLARRVRQGCTDSPPTPLTPLLQRVAVKFSFSYFRKIFAKILISGFAEFFLNFAKFKIILSKICVSQNFDKIVLNVVKFDKNLAKLEN